MSQPLLTAHQPLGAVGRRRTLLYRGAWLAIATWLTLGTVFWALGESVWRAAVLIASIGAAVLVALRLTDDLRNTARVAFLAMAVAHGWLLWLAGGPVSLWAMSFAVMVAISALILDRAAYHAHAWLMMGIAVFVGWLHAPWPGPGAAEMLTSTVILFSGVLALYVMGLFVIRYYDDYAARIGISERLLRAAVQTAGVGVWEWHIEAERHYPSVEALRILGVDAGAMDRQETDQFLKRLLSMEDFDRLDGATHHCRNTGEDQYLEVKLKDTERWIGVYLSTLTGESGQPTHLVAALRDLTEERTREAKKSAFIATMSHELRTPLNGILGMASLMDDDTLSLHHQRYLQRIQASGRHMVATISDVLDFERIEAGALTVEEYEVDVRPVVQSAVALCASQGGRDDVDLAVHVDPDVPARVRTDAARLSQVLVNLVGNALKFTARGHVFVSVRLAHESIAITVEDTGIGIPAEKLKVIFEPFERVENERTRSSEGQGLGLAISRRLTRLLGGTLNCTSSVDVGSVFELRIPVAGASAPPPRVDLERTTVLSVCRLPKTAHVVASALRHHGATVIEVDDMEHADAASHAGDVDLIVLTDPALTFRQARDVVERWPSRRALVVSNRLGPEIARCHVCTGLDYPVAASTLVRLAHTVLNEVTTDELDVAPASLATQCPLQIGVVEDDPTNLMVTRRLLQREGYDVRTATNGREAIMLAERDHCELLFMDLRMPVLDGIAATRAIRGSQTMTNQPTIIAFTADVTHETREACDAAGIDFVLAKPAQVADIREAIRRAWASRGHR